MKSIVLVVALAGLGRQQMHGAHRCDEPGDLVIADLSDASVRTAASLTGHEQGN